ncbi:MAG: T9SS type A sorting domain-containing protein [Flavobacteriales bacterium]
MKKALLIAASAALLSGSAFAQMPDNSICPDWTGTDLNGTSHNLYSLLDSGYTVFIDVSATWCPPCWSYHQAHHLKNLYNQYGPGTVENKVRVFFIEGDNSTTLANLNGQGSNTLGDWVTGTPYPIIDNASIANLLQITYFPTIYKVCPNRLVTEIGQKTTSQLWASVASCQAAVHATDPSLLPTSSLAACIGNDVTLTARMQNMGTTPLTSATIEARQGTTVLGSTTWTGNLATYAITDVPVTTFAPTANTSVNMVITSTDDNTSNNSTNVLVTANSTAATSTQVTMQLQTDNYGSETSWKLFKPDGTVQAQAGPFTNGQNQPVKTYNWNLQDMNCYRLEFYDAYGDGFCCSYGQGWYKVISNGVTIIQGGTFTEVDVKPFSVNTSLAGIATNELERSLNVYPNPTTGLVNLEYSLDQGAKVKVVISDVVGKVVMERTILPASGAQRETLDINNLSNGVYILKVNAGDHQATRTITLNK